MKILEGNLINNDAKIGIVVARFNEFITSKLLGGAVDTLVRHGISDDNISVAWVPGAFEIPLIAKKMAQTGNYDAVICLGAIIRGSTSHYDLVCNEAAKGVAQVSLEAGNKAQLVGQPVSGTHEINLFSSHYLSFIYIFFSDAPIFWVLCPRSKTLHIQPYSSDSSGNHHHHLYRNVTQKKRYPYQRYQH